MRPLVSILLNSYNQSKYVAASIESVLAQTMDDFELIFTDNGSTDETAKIVQRYASDARLRLVLHRTNEPISRRFNQAVAMARGEYVSFLYSDDFYLPEKLERQVKLFESLAEDYGVVYSPGIFQNETTGERWVGPSIRFSGLILGDMLDGYRTGPINMISPLTRRACFTGQPFHEDLFAEGEAYFYRIAMRWKLHFDPKPLVVMRDHGANAGKAIRRNYEMVMVCLDRLATDPAFPSQHRAQLRRFRAARMRDHAWELLRLNGNAAWARQAVADSFRTDVGVALHPRTLGALALASVPASLRRFVNQLGDKLHRQQSHKVLVDDY